MRSCNKEGEKGLKCSKCMYQVAIKNKNQKKKALVKLRKHEKECKEEKKLDDKTEESGDIFGGTTANYQTIQVEETDESNEEYKLETQTEKEGIGPTLERPDGEGNGNSSNNGYNGSDADLLNHDTS